MKNILLKNVIEYVDSKLRGNNLRMVTTIRIPHSRPLPDAVDELPNFKIIFKNATIYYTEDESVITDAKTGEVLKVSSYLRDLINSYFTEAYTNVVESYFKGVDVVAFTSKDKTQRLDLFLRRDNHVLEFARMGYKRNFNFRNYEDENAFNNLTAFVSQGFTYYNNGNGINGLHLSGFRNVFVERVFEKFRDISVEDYMKPLTLDKSINLDTLDKSTCSDEHKNVVFVIRNNEYYGSYVLDDTSDMIVCGKSGYLLTSLRNSFNERMITDGNEFFSRYVMENKLISFCPNCNRTILDNSMLCSKCERKIKEHDLDAKKFINNTYRIEDYFSTFQLEFLAEKEDLTNEGTPLFIGVEVEVDSEIDRCDCGDDDCDVCNGSDEDRENNGLNHEENSNISGHALVSGGNTPNGVMIKRDGSLDAGFEIVSQPATLRAHVSGNYIDWQKGFRTLSKLGYTSHDKGTCGLHTHINRNFFGSNKTTQNYNGAKIVYLMEKFWDEFVLFSRRKMSQLDRWARKCNAKDDFDNYETKTARTLSNSFAKSYITPRTKYVALNTLHTHTFELRIFRGTLNINTFKATLQFVDNLARLVKKTTLTRLTSLTFDDIINFKKYPELTAYWNLRKENRTNDGGY